MNSQRKLTFDEQCRLLFNTDVDRDYLSDSVTRKLHARLSELLPVSEPKAELFERYREFRKQMIIPKNQYEPQFRGLIGDVLKKIEAHVPELVTAHVVQRYVDDSTLCFEATCEAKATNQSEMLVNISRPITFDKAQQLAAHELTHHMQFVLMQRHLYNKYPEMCVSLDEGPMGMLLEGGAELAVDLLFPPEERVRDLVQRVPESLRPLVVKALEVERISWAGLWQCSIRIAKDMIDGHISKDEAQRLMLELALKDNDSWPNVDFIEQYGAYIQSYGWGKELLRRYLTAQLEMRNVQVDERTLMEAYVEFVKRPVTPANMAKALLRRERF